ncbi:2-oxoglutarate-dependent ethylene/succinate-forming enzyme OS=Tsukamurella paurometabola (strain ATCC 8368 / DSM / CCUG 35730 / CIP 100753 / JCM 10117 /KCTC 9821 / NBRC 16120 / NCIMB 702349 / NCTC 13040) OX=521096 GN=Tpau_3166 PE=3 SV=1 [Tsukamurella paurometabola]|uniref:2OG-Fe(II) oxygenase n=1 Tax=Tsukamurella paurometabola (strain ATCC 8368 / DSM 20162 / CCUG 35730 / CIP 100753 / JCM 10117 / KCTC 9821 / NBRC 16120 / NCIMB 702349 / NCTC 13040) TaxID=521096 RepID=D5UVH1_TSUPD|nr:2-oxoglutarate and iron-dependent oxygenase domain-containing protein [Tsukamurella paurometabola]ADG79753.1 2OG-Fe(II) oxygenase [Tsukamurella paurometabola DSM 20162]SUP37063.1 2-oxoglutarate-dependent ethylene/succinate-forming enzyme [Tsukamurella paurometabola]
MTVVPVLDLSLLDTAPEQFDALVRTAAHDVGFFYLTGHGLGADRIDEILAVARRFFALPQREKDAIAMANSPHFRGYTRLGGELTRGAVDWREQIDIGPERAAPTGPGPDHRNLVGPNQWPANLPELRTVIERWDADLSRIALDLLTAWARSLGADPRVFDEAFTTDPATLIKIVRYPAGTDTEQGVGAHKDSGVLTLLLADPDSEGLQVLPPGADEWVDVPPQPGTFIVNIGEMLEVGTEGYLRATEHRVVNRRAGADRISVPYFFNPSVHARMPQLPLPAGLRSGVTVDPENPIFDTYGENAWKSRLRAHPDVAARHYPNRSPSATAEPIVEA